MAPGLTSFRHFEYSAIGFIIFALSGARIEDPSSCGTAPNDLLSEHSSYENTGVDRVTTKESAENGAVSYIWYLVKNAVVDDNAEAWR